MIDCSEFIAGLRTSNINLVTGVPDSLLKDICACFSSQLAPEQHIIATNEGSAVGLAIGHYLSTANPALVYMQNSGLGNIVNPISSLADPLVYAIPMVLMVGWRGEMQDDQSQISDEPQHLKQGRITLTQLDTLGIPYTVVHANTDAIASVLQKVASDAIERGGPAALVVRKNTFAPFDYPSQAQTTAELSREEAIRQIISVLPDDACIVSTTGMASRELFEIRANTKAGHQRDFLTVGGMGHASQIAAGIAFSQPHRRVVCIDGDGALLMHSGSLAISADCPNLIHIVLNNAAHDSVGGQPTKGNTLRFDKIAAAFGYRHTDQAIDSLELLEKLNHLLKLNGSIFLEISCRRGARKDLGRPDRTPTQNKSDFMKFLRIENE